MSTVVVALITAVSGVLAGLAPTLMSSSRAKILRLLDEEAKAIEASADEQTRDELVRTRQVTAIEYRRVATLSPSARARRRLLFATPILYITVLVGVALVVAPQTLTDNVSHQQVWRDVGIGILALSALVFVVLVLVLLNARSEARKWQRLLASERRARRSAEHSIDQTAEELKGLQAINAEGTEPGSVDTVEDSSAEAIRRIVARLEEEQASRASEEARHEAAIRVARYRKLLAQAQRNYNKLAANPTSDDAVRAASEKVTRRKRQLAKEAAAQARLEPQATPSQGEGR